MIKNYKIEVKNYNFKKYLETNKSVTGKVKTRQLSWNGNMSKIFVDRCAKNIWLMYTSLCLSKVEDLVSPRILK